jgi:hypothetical protein
LARALREQAGIGDHHQFFGLGFLGEQHAQIGPNASRLAGGDGDDGLSLS